MVNSTKKQTTVHDWRSPVYAYMSPGGAARHYPAEETSVCRICREPEHAGGECPVVCDICWRKGSHLPKHCPFCPRCLVSTEHGEDACTGSVPKCAQCGEPHPTEVCETYTEEKARLARYEAEDPFYDPMPERAGRRRDMDSQTTEDDRLTMKLWEQYS